MSEKYKQILKAKEDELAELVGRFQAQRMMAIFNGNAGSNTLEKLYLLGKEEKQDED